MIFIIFLNILATLFSLSYNTKITGANLIAPVIKKIQTHCFGLYFFLFNAFNRLAVSSVELLLFPFQKAIDFLGHTSHME